jgi:hypothetical protein
MHTNSLESYRKCKEDNKFTKLIYKIARFYEDHSPDTFTDRCVKDTMFRAGELPFNDMNMVRPKITRLISDGLLKESGKTKDVETNRQVRKVRWNNNELF